ncbi:Chromo domain-containing protein [Pleurotus pulmonarius]
MGKKKNRQPQSEEYHVEVITAARVLDTLEWEYHVKWAGYDSESDSWEPQANVESCTDLLKRFWKHIGLDDEDYPAGHVCEAKQAWIKKEKKMFANNFPEVLQTQKQRARAEKAAKSVGEASPAASSSSKTKGKRKRSKGVSSIVDDESSDGEPLAKKAKPTLKPTTPIAQDKGKETAVESPSSPVYFGGDVVNLFTPPDSPSKVSPTRPAKPSSPEAPTTSSSSFPVPSEQHWRRKLQTQGTAPRTTIVGSSLSTKQRLSQDALSVTPANIKATKKASLAGLSFKKKPDAGVATTSGATNSTAASMPLPRRNATGSEPTISIPDSPVAARETSHSMFLPGVTQPSPPVQSPVDIFRNTLHNEETPHYEDYNEPHMEDFMSELHLPSPKNLLMDQAEQFLQSAMPLELAAALPPEPSAKEQTQAKDNPQEPEIPAPVTTLLRPKVPSKAQTRYSWEGPLWSEDGDKSEHICDICITDVSDPLPDGLRLNVLLQTVDSFRCKGLYDQMDVVQILLACKKIPQQFARITPKGPNDTDALTALTKSINRLRQAIILPLYLDNKIVSLLLVFSAIGSRPLARKLSLPQNYQQSRTPVAVLLAWSLPNYERQEWRSPVNKPIYRSVPYEPPSMSTRQSRRLCTLMRVLRFPQDLHEFMSRTTRTYCLWWEGGDGGPAVDNQKWETKTLKKVLQSCGAEDGGHDKDVRVVFIHVASVLTLHRLPNFLDRRSKRLEVCFYTYGTHHRVPPSLWGIRPIYLAGGIVTFTPQALLGNPDILRIRIKQIVAHPLWDCYVLPTTVAIASLLSAGKDDPLDLFDQGKLFTEYYLQMIEEGDIAMVESPPLEPYLTNPRALEWRAATEAQRGFTRRDYLEYALKEFNASYSNVPESNWLKTAEGVIAKDLHMMQAQPCIMAEYRRFVIIRGSQESYHPDEVKDSFEWVSVEKFDFNDNLFNKWNRSQLEKFDDWEFPIL